MEIDKIKKLLELLTNVTMKVSDTANFAIQHGTPENNIYLATLVNISNYTNESMKEFVRIVKDEV